MLRGIREHRPLDLNAEVWRANNPRGSFEAWRAVAHRCLLKGLHYNPGQLDLKSETLSREEHEHLIVEEVAFNTTPWIRVEGYLLLPKRAQRPAPGLVVFHAWGGPMLFGRKRIVNSGRDHEVLRQHREAVYSGNYLAKEFARAGYAVIVIDAHHFGDRAPRGIGSIPGEYDPFELTVDEYKAVDAATRDELYYGMRQLNWAGTTWMGLNYWDDSRCVDYLLSRPEVDSNRIGCTGLSGGGWRTDILAALDRRIKASVSGCWMTTGDYQQIYNVRGAIGTFCMLPGVWDRMDIPDLSILAAPNATMVISTSEDQLFPVEGQQEAARQIQAGFEWAGCPEKFRNVDPPKPHCYDADLQQIAIEWFDDHLKRG